MGVETQINLNFGVKLHSVWTSMSLSPSGFEYFKDGAQFMELPDGRPAEKRTWAEVFMHGLPIDGHHQLSESTRTKPLPKRKRKEKEGLNDEKCRCECCGDVVSVNCGLVRTSWGANARFVSMCGQCYELECCRGCGVWSGSGLCRGCRSDMW